MRGAQVEDGLGRGQVLNVAVLGLKLWMEISKRIFVAKVVKISIGLLKIFV